MTAPQITPGPWVARRYIGNADSWFIVSAVDAAKICGGGGTPITEANAKAIAALPQMVEALQSFKCGGCGGSGKYKDKGFRPPLADERRQDPPEFREELVTCKRCQGGGLEPAAATALRAAGVIE